MQLNTKFYVKAAGIGMAASGIITVLAKDLVAAILIVVGVVIFYFAERMK